MTTPISEYLDLIEKLSESDETVRKLQTELAELKKALPDPQASTTFSDMFLETNLVSEKVVIGTIAFLVMCIFGIVDLTMDILGTPIAIDNSIFLAFVSLTLGAFGIDGIQKMRK